LAIECAATAGGHRMIQRQFLKLGKRLFLLAAVVAAFAPSNLTAQSSEELTVKRIYSQPSLSGRVSRGVQWSPDSQLVSFFETKGQSKESKTELWAMDAVTGEQRMLVSSEKLENILPAEKSQPTQSTGLGRRAASQYFWAPDGNSILFIGTKSLALLDLKTQQARVLLADKGAIADVKFSPDGKSISYVSQHNLHVITVADGKDHVLTNGGTEEVRKGELDWVYPEELDIKTAYWW